MNDALSETSSDFASYGMRIAAPFFMPPKDSPAAIDERSTISFGVVLTIIVAVLAFLGGGSAWVWWASNVSARLAGIEQYMSTQNAKVMLVDQIDARVKMIETYGSPTVKASVERLEKELSDLRRTVEVQASRKDSSK